MRDTGNARLTFPRGSQATQASARRSTCACIRVDSSIACSPGKQRCSILPGSTPTPPTFASEGSSVVQPLPPSRHCHSRTEQFPLSLSLSLTLSPLFPRHVLLSNSSPKSRVLIKTSKRPTVRPFACKLRNKRQSIPRGMKGRAERNICRRSSSRSETTAANITREYRATGIPIIPITRVCGRSLAGSHTDRDVTTGNTCRTSPINSDAS